jgi:hypothetical protein
LLKQDQIQKKENKESKINFERFEHKNDGLLKTKHCVKLQSENTQFENKIEKEGNKYIQN